MNRVLWAEDDDDDAFLMELAFEKAAVPNLLFRVSDGAQAMAYLAGQEPFSDRVLYPLPLLLLLDIKMPQMSGLEVLAWKSSQPELRELPTVILTTSQHLRDMEEAYRLGAKAYLVKPSTFEGLVDQVKKLHAEWLRSSPN